LDFGPLPGLCHRRSLRRLRYKIRISGSFLVQPVNFLRVLYASFHEALFKNPNEMASENFTTAISPNFCNGFTASKCKISNVYRSPYGFTAPRGYIHLLPSRSSVPPFLLIITIVIQISACGWPSSNICYSATSCSTAFRSAFACSCSCSHSCFPFELSPLWRVQHLPPFKNSARSPRLPVSQSQSLPISAYPAPPLPLRPPVDYSSCSVSCIPASSSRPYVRKNSIRQI
jgi:hypothetical protein